MSKSRKLLSIALALALMINTFAIGASATIGDGDALTAVVNLEVYNTSGTGVAGDPYVATTPFSGAALNTNDVVMVRIIPQTDFLCGASRYAIMFNNALFSIVGTGKNAFTPNLANTFYDQVASGWSGATTVPSTAWPASIAAQASTYKAVCVANTADVTSNNGGFPALIPGDSWLFSFCIKAKTAITAGSGAKVWMDNSWFQTPADTTAAAYFAKVEPGQVYDPLLEDFRDRYSTEGSATTYNYKFDINDDISLEPAAVSQSTITFDSNGGSAVASITQDEGTAVTAPAAPTKAGFTFNGWLPTVPATMPVDDLTCVAQWTEIIAPTSTITFDPAGGSAVASITQDEGTAVTAPANPTKQGYVFDGWLPVVPATMPVDDLTCVAQWTKNQSTITFDSAGGTPAIDPITQDEGTDITAPADPAREGYTFTGWIPAVPATMPVDDIACVAQWKAITYFANFYVDSVLYEGLEYTYGDTLAAPADPAKAGHVFAGWDPELPATMPAEDLRFDALWSKNNYTITFEANGGIGGDIQTVAFGEMPTAPTVTKTGYTFDGWLPAVEAASSDATYTAQWKAIVYFANFYVDSVLYEGLEYSYGDTLAAPATNPEKNGWTFTGWDPALPATMPASDLRFDAMFTQNEYSVWFYDGSTLYWTNSPNHVHVGELTPTPPTNPTKEGFIFAGWSPAVPEFYQTNFNTTYATWTPVVNPKSTITFDSAGGTDVDPITQDEGTDITAPADPAREGYTFTGWIPAVPATMPVDDMTCVAQWQVNKYNAIFKTNGDVYQTVETEFGAVIVLPANPDIEGYFFNGWISVPATMPANDVEINADLRLVTTTITFDTAGGSAIDSISGNFGAEVSAPADPTRSGYTFTGWTPVIPATFPASDLTVLAGWEVNQNPTSQIFFDLRGGRWPGGFEPTLPWTQDEGTVVLPFPDPIRDGFIFTGWIPAIPATMPVDDMTCVAQWEAIVILQSTITFDSAGGTAVAPITQDEGTAVTAPADPTREGFTFTGWFDSNNTQFTFPMNMPADDLAFTAGWQINTYMAWFYVDGEFYAKIGSSFGASIETPETDPAKAGYTFVGWDPAIPATMPSNDLTFNALWQLIPTSTITFDSAGGSAVAPITQDEGTAVVAPSEPTKAGFTFAGWIPDVPATMPVDDVTCEAQWEEIQIPQTTITFNSAGGSWIPPIIGDPGDPVLPPQDPERPGYTFKGWMPAVPATMPVDDIECVAQWDINQYTITFDTDGGSAVVPITQDFESAVTAPADPTKAGFTFDGWLPAVPAVMPLDGATCVAQWIQNQSTITFDTFGGSAVAPITQDEGTAVTPPAAPTKAGYTFAGWLPAVPAEMPVDDMTCVAQWTIQSTMYTWDPNGGTWWDGTTGLKYTYSGIIIVPMSDGMMPPGPVFRTGYTFSGWSPVMPSTVPPTDMTFTAQWTINSYNITFDANGGIGGEVQTVDYGDTPQAPTVTWEGYIFVGWAPEIVPATIDATYTALWQEIIPETGTIIFDTAGGSAIAPITGDVGDTVTPPADPKRPGCVFLGWSPAIPAAFTAGNVTVVAQWKLLGDVDDDGDWDVIDALMALQGSTEERILTQAQIDIADVDGDGRLSALDALLILHFVSGRITDFPVNLL